ncbi:glycoside hydrolase family 16 protein [Serpula lacrymans var. lacrymans S7.3]|uniref:Glycoside hydrolase family 16 protein n=2 Tax=Serpula lacrymans var. lacrymans TaxID=341189 RepID=F8PNM2_SERL3|nr:glycoside hydrolase family 16 protein [Serpula lacrymans var. lacrymans S7.9]EGO01749.1 glycoside hydrolase family 16 protein [Serpula lacrymans var. lacrymans S7.3]EGO27386.1 glycoside hydrolase family 16 protein [Serpula lacrymans var. lacrymans S7.9]
MKLFATVLLRSLFFLLSLRRRAAALPDFGGSPLGFRSELASERFLPEHEPPGPVLRRDGNSTSSNASDVLWVIEDNYEGQTFFDRFDFYTGADPTHGMVDFVDQQTAYSSGLAYVTSNNKVIMKGDNTTTLAMGANRGSVRISSQAIYNTGLFILDLDMAPWGCAVWPAFWTLGGGTWPYSGEIDILEGVHDNQYNQVTWHTAPGCMMTSTVNMTGTIDQINGTDNLDCNALINSNSGCAVTEWSRASYGPYFDSQGGGVFAMKWDDDGISVWSFYRAAIPTDIVQGNPNPAGWGVPVASLSPEACNPTQYFVNHSVIFDITFCGDWAGNSYTTSGCPGTCEERLVDPANFVNASWIINSLKVYKRASVSVSNDATQYAVLGPALIGWILLSIVLNVGL